MEEVLEIITEVKEKKGREFLGLPSRVEKQLKQLIWFLDHPTIIEQPKKQEELASLYQKSKSHNFLKMEEIKRKLDQLKVTIGEPGSIRKVGINIKKKVAPTQAAAELAKEKNEIYIDDYFVAIEDLRDNVQELLDSSQGSSLPKQTNQSLVRLLSYLEDSKLESKPELFKEIYGAYQLAEGSDFRKMQSLNDILDKAEVKLGAFTKKKSKWKSLEERKKDFELELKEFQKEKAEIVKEWKKIENAQQKLERERKRINEETKILEEEKQKLKDEKMLLEDAKIKLRAEKTLIDEEKNRIREAKNKNNQLDGLKPPK